MPVYPGALRVADNTVSTNLSYLPSLVLGPVLEDLMFGI
jgi:hypothetical protein